MAVFESCSKCKFDGKSPTEKPCCICTHGASDYYKPKSNADHIRSMTDEELAKFLHNFNDCDCCLIEVCNEGTCGIACMEGILQWLKSEAKE